MNLFIKNMVCNRCILAIEEVFKEMKISPTSITLGEVHLIDNLSSEDKKIIDKKLKALGFELLDDQQQKLIEKIKSIIISKIQNFEEKNDNYSEILSKSLNKEYSSLSKLFSSIEGITIEQYIILQKIEKVKELITYNEMNLSEIAHALDYSSVAHLSAQFKRVTGLTPSQFKIQRPKLRKPLDKI